MPMTVKQIEAARFGVAKERLSDGGGLYLRLFPNGSKRFQVQIAKAPGLTGRGWVTLGDYPTLSLKSARGLAARVRALSEDGLTIAAVRDELRKLQPSSVKAPARGNTKRSTALSDSGILLCDAAMRWFENKRPTLSNGKHVNQNWNTIATYILPHLGDRPVTDIKRRDIVETLKPIWHAKNVTAARTLGRVKEIFELARLEHDLDIPNPAVFCTRTAFGYISTRTKHFVSLPHARMPEFWTWLQDVDCHENIRISTQLLVLTAKRTHETRFANWSFFNADRTVWTTPETLMKARLPHRVPLSRQAKVLVDNAALLSVGHRHVFAKPSTKSGTISENAILQLVKRFEPDLTGHGFRATFKTWGRLQRRYSHDALEYALAHVPSKLEKTYMRDDLLEERAELMQDWADFVTGGEDPRSLREILRR